MESVLMSVMSQIHVSRSDCHLRAAWSGSIYIASLLPKSSLAKTYTQRVNRSPLMNHSEANLLITESAFNLLLGMGMLSDAGQ